MAVIGLPRCASTLVCEGLAQHPSCLAFGEVFSEHEHARKHFHRIRLHDERAYDPEKPVEDYMEMLISVARWERKEVLAFKLLDYQNTDAWEYIRRRPTIDLIYCRRDNPIESLLSVVAASYTGLWHARDHIQVAKTEGQKFELSLSAVKEWLARNAEFERMLETLENRQIEVRYSDVRRDFAAAMNTVFASMGLSRQNVVATQVKIARGLLRDRISNYAELSVALRDTEWSQYIP